MKLFWQNFKINLIKKHALSDKAKKVKFDPEIASKQECLITTFQECYHESDSFQEAKEKMRFLFD